MFGTTVSGKELDLVTAQVTRAMRDAFESTSTMDAAGRMEKVVAASNSVLLDFFSGPGFRDLTSTGIALTSIPSFRIAVASRSTALLDHLRAEFLSGARGNAPASTYLNRTRPIYEFVRLTLGIRMHGLENYNKFAPLPGLESVTVGQSVSLIHEVRCSYISECFVCLMPSFVLQAIRDGKMQYVVADLFA
jgi:phenylalanine ammonia-lyase